MTHRSNRIPAVYGGLRSASYRQMKNWHLTLWGRNLGDEEWAATRDTILGTGSTVYGAPRTYGLKIGYQF